MKARLPLVVCLAATLAVAIPDLAFAQVDKLDRNQLVEELKRQGMTELLLRLLETEGDKFEPVERKRIEIAAWSTRASNSQLSQAERNAALDKMLDLYRALIKDHSDDPARPMWQVEFAQEALLRELRSADLYAPLFYTLGVPAEQQKEAFESLVPEIYEQLTDAEIGFFRALGDIPRRDDFQTQWAATGKWRQFKQDYHEMRLPFFMAHAAYYVSQLPDSHPYYQKLGKNPMIPRQRSKPEDERKRLLAQAQGNLNKFLQPDFPVRAVRVMAQSLGARVALARGKTEEGINLANEVGKASPGSLDDLTASLAKARLLETDGKSQAAEGVAERLLDHAQAQSNPLFQLLVIDALHKLRLTRIEGVQDRQKRRELLIRAYKPYDDYFENPKLKDQAVSIRAYVFRRWANELRDAENIIDYPPIVLVAVGQLAFDEGHFELSKAKKIEDEAKRKEAIAKAITKLKRAIEVNQTLLKQDDLSPVTRAQSTLNLGYAKYDLLGYETPLNFDNILAVTDIWVEQAISDDKAIREEAATLTGLAQAVNVLSLQMDQNPPQKVRDAYRKAVEILLGQGEYENITAYKDSPQADNEKKGYAFYFLQQEGKYEKAAELYNTIPRQHVDYFEAQGERVYCLYQIHEQKKDHKESFVRLAAQRAAETAAEQLLDEVTPAISKAPEARKSKLKRVEADAKITLAKLYLDKGGGLHEQAGKVIAGWESRYQDQSERIVREFLELDLAVAVTASDMRRVQTVAEKMLAQFPAKAGSVIDGVLESIREQMLEATRQFGQAPTEDSRTHWRNKRDGLASAAVNLAQQMVKWAEAQIKAGKMAKSDLYYYQLIEAKALRVSNQLDKAIALLQPMMQDDVLKDNPEVMLELAEAMAARQRAKDKQADFTEVFALTTRIIRAVEFERDQLAEANPTKPLPPYPDFYWHAWHLGLQCLMDRPHTDQKAEKDALERVVLEIRKLKLKDKSLGGDKWGPRFRDLERTAENRLRLLEMR